MENDVEYFITFEKLWTDWSEGKDSIGIENLVLKIEKLYKDLWIIETEFTPEQKEQKLESLEKYSKTDFNRETFYNYFSENLREILKIHYVIGIDVGGTNTDAVVLKMPSIEVLASVKVTTTSDVRGGVLEALVKVFENLNSNREKKIEKKEITSILIGTTVFVNAVIQRSDKLSKVNVIRLCGESTTGIEPFITFPDDLTIKIKDKVYYLSGGMSFTGAEELYPFSESEVIKVGEELVEQYFRNKEESLNVAIIGVFSTVNNVQEKRASKILKNLFKQKGVNSFNITLSHKIGETGFIERENATILNSSLRPYANSRIRSFRKALDEFGFQNSFFFTQNDGTIADSEFTIKYPALTFSAGPVNSLRGASFLCRVRDCVVADIGGTTCDLAVMKDGFARESTNYINIGGVRTNFKMPNVNSVGLGGGSIIQFTDNGEVRVGPASVGYNLAKQGKCFGGDILTTTDIALKKGLIKEFANANKNLVTLSEEKVNLALQGIIDLLQDSIDSTKTKPGDIELILVGGGSIIIPSDVKLKGVSKIHIPNHFGIANAIGAAISKVSGSIDTIFSKDSQLSREEFIKKKIHECKEMTIKKGALDKFIGVSQVTEVHLTYLPNDTRRISIKTIGNIDYNKINNQIDKKPVENVEEQNNKENLEDSVPTQKIKESESNNVEHTLKKYNFHEPKINFNQATQRNEWILNQEDLEFISIGAAILGSGGGGSPLVSYLLIKKCLSQGKTVRVISPDDLKSDELSIPLAFIGSPVCGNEKLLSGKEHNFSVDYFLAQDYGEKKITSCMPCEIGGFNSLIPMKYAAENDIPVVDCDLIGRAYPKMNHTVTHIYGKQHPPYCLSDDLGRVFTTMESEIPKIEEFLTTNLVKSSCSGGITLAPLDSSVVMNYTVKYTLSRVWRLGRDIVKARVEHLPMLKLLEEKENAKLLIEGKIIDLNRSSKGVWDVGTILIEGVGKFSNKFVEVQFQNENLIAYKWEKTQAKDEKKVIAVTPDIISLLDIDSFDAILCENLKFGVKVYVVALPADEILTSEECLKVIGPKGFGYQDVEYVRFANSPCQKSVILKK